MPHKFRLISYSNKLGATYRYISKSLLLKYEQTQKLFLVTSIGRFEKLKFIFLVPQICIPVPRFLQIALSVAYFRFVRVQSHQLKKHFKSLLTRRKYLAVIFYNTTSKRDTISFYFSFPILFNKWFML